MTKSSKKKSSSKSQSNNNKSKVSQYKMLRKSELSHDQQKILKNYCKHKNIEFISTNDIISQSMNNAQFLYFCKKGTKNRVKVNSVELSGSIGLLYIFLSLSSFCLRGIISIFLLLRNMECFKTL